MEEMLMKLGCKPSHHDARTLKLSKYLLETLPAPPASVDYTTGVTAWPMFKNDTVGCCTCASKGHGIVERTTEGELQPFIPTDDQILAVYEAVTAQENNGQGYDPATGNNDNGCEILDVLKYYKSTGIAGDTLGAYASVNPANNQTEVEQAIYLFGGVDIGVSLPLTAQKQEVWDVATVTDGSDAPASWGGHDVIVIAYDAEGLTCITWGSTKRMTWAFWAKYVTEAWALLDQDWINPSSGVAPSGFDLATLMVDLAAVTA